jgi:hypothetical protein
MKLLSTLSIEELSMVNSSRVTFKNSVPVLKHIYIRNGSFFKPFCGKIKT